jgi:hypothetical protein
LQVSLCGGFFILYIIWICHCWWNTTSMLKYNLVYLYWYNKVVPEGEPRFITNQWCVYIIIRTLLYSVFNILPAFVCHWKVQMGDMRSAVIENMMPCAILVHVWHSAFVQVSHSLQLIVHICFFMNYQICVRQVHLYKGLPYCSIVLLYIWIGRWWEEVVYQKGIKKEKEFWLFCADYI